MIIRSLQH